GSAAHQRHPTMGKPNGLVGVTARLHVVYERAHRRPVVAQGHGRLWASAVLLRREFGRGSTSWADNIRIVIPGIGRGRIGTIHDAAIPCAVISGRPFRFAVLCKAIGLRGSLAFTAGAVIAVPIGPVDPTRAVIAGTDVHVLHERDDRYVYIPVC